VLCILKLAPAVLALATVILSFDTHPIPIARLVLWVRGKGKGVVAYFLASNPSRMNGYLLSTPPPIVTSHRHHPSPPTVTTYRHQPPSPPTVTTHRRHHPLSRTILHTGLPSTTYHSPYRVTLHAEPLPFQVTSHNITPPQHTIPTTYHSSIT